MLLPNQVMPFLAHEDAIVREHAVRYFEHAQDMAPLTSDDCWAAIDAVELGREAAGLIRLLPELPQSDASTARLIAALDLPPEQVVRSWLMKALEELSFEQLRRHADAIFCRADLQVKTREHLQARLDLANEQVGRLWDQLEAHAKGIEDKYWNEIDHRVAARLLEAIARLGQELADRALRIAGSKENDATCLQIFAVDLLGRLRHRPALDTVVQLYADVPDSDDVMHETLQDAIPRIGGVDAIAPLEALLPKLRWGTRLYGWEMLRRTHHPEAEAALLRMLKHEALIESRDGIANALAGLCTTAGLGSLREIVLSGQYDSLDYDLQGDLVACAMMARASGVDFDFPELAALREETVARHIEQQRRMEEWNIDSPLDHLADDLRAEDFAGEHDLPDLPPALDDRGPRVTAPIRRDPATPGRNDPCPCGSGKKYKKCCLK